MSYTVDEFSAVAALAGQRTGVFHIAERDAWDAAQADGSYRPPSLAQEGFIHCSTRDQVLATAQRFYAGRSDLLLLRVDAVALAPLLRYEAPSPPARPSSGLGDALFPHLYGPLPVESVLDVWPLTPGTDGGFGWPVGAEPS